MNEEIKKLVKMYPNDVTLGKAVRELYHNKEHQDTNELSQEDWVCEYCNDSTYYVDLDYIGSKANHLGCELEEEMKNHIFTTSKVDLDIPAWQEQSVTE